MADPVTLAMIGSQVGLSLADRFLGSRGDKKEKEKNRRADALSQLIGSLSSRGQGSQGQQQQREQVSPLQTILRDPLVRDLLAQKLGGLTNSNGNTVKPNPLASITGK
jgi:hypothetical protein